MRAGLEISPRELGRRVPPEMKSEVTDREVSTSFLGGFSQISLTRVGAIDQFGERRL